MRYFLKRNAAKPLVIDNTQFRFTICEQAAGTWWGVYATEDENEIRLLEKAKVREIDRAMYDARLKARNRDRNSSMVETAGDYRPLQASQTKEAQVESVETKEVPESEMQATITANSPDGKTYVTQLPELAEALEISMEELSELRSRPGAPERKGKGYHVPTFREFLAGVTSGGSEDSGE